MARADGASWLISAATREPSAVASIVEALEGCMRALELPVAPPGDGPGAIVFEHADERVLTLVRDSSRGGQRRVLGIATTPDALHGDAAWRLLAAGLADVIAWDGTPDPVRARIARWQTIDELVASPVVREHLVGSSPAWLAVLRDIVEIARFSTADVLICGESGTGKELCAQLIHTLDPRTDKRDLVVVDCTTIVPALSGSEFFGHERGAFTGAIAARDGAFALADGGTLFLDEIGELPPELQAELLRAVQEGTYKRVGSNRWQRARFRLICATNRDLRSARANGTFRNDLYFRLAAATITLPALRTRREDIIDLAEHFISAPATLSRPVRDHLQARDYPGNVRDLKQLIARINLRHVGPGPITVGDLPPTERPATDTNPGWQDDLRNALRRAIALGIPLKDIIDAARDHAITLAVTHNHGSLRHAATQLGVTDRTLQLHRQRHRNNHHA